MTKAWDNERQDYLKQINVQAALAARVEELVRENQKLQAAKLCIEVLRGEVQRLKDAAIKHSSANPCGQGSPEAWRCCFCDGLGFDGPQSVQHKTECVLERE